MNLDNVRIVNVCITPDMAREWLNHMVKNRPIRSKTVSMIANDIKNGDFTFSDSLICFNEDGMLVNGQHRLSAIIKADMPCNMLVAFNAPPDAIYDRNSSRTVYDNLCMREICQPEFCGRETMSIVNAYFDEKYGTHNTFTETQKGRFMAEHSKELMAVKSIRRVGASSNSMCRKAHVGAAILAALIYGIDESTLYRFAEIVNTGVCTNKSETAAITLRRWLEGKGAKDSTVNRGLQTLYTENAIQDFIAGKPRSNIYSPNCKHVYILKEET